VNLPRLRVSEGGAKGGEHRRGSFRAQQHNTRHQDSEAALANSLSSPESKQSREATPLTVGGEGDQEASLTL